jgi:putative hemolysin
MLKKQGLHVKKLLPLTDAIMKPRQMRLNKFKPKVKLLIERERFTIKTAENFDELIMALKLRYDVFYRELLDKTDPDGMDVDKFDFGCDHLIVVDKRTGAFVGTYRLISSLYVKKFYSETEFDLSSILGLPGVKLELGRACVHQDYRSGSSIALLWRGITEYMKQTGTQYLFGCSSVKSTNKHEIAAIHKSLSREFSAPSTYAAVQRPMFKIKKFDQLINSVTDEDEKAVEELIPALIKSYINMGALICGEPAYDKKFKCADFLTLFNVDKSSDIVHKKYKI